MKMLQDKRDVENFCNDSKDEGRMMEFFRQLKENHND